MNAVKKGWHAMRPFLYFLREIQRSIQLLKVLETVATPYK